MLMIAFSTLERSQSQWNCTGIFFKISSPNSPRISVRISSGVFPASRRDVMEEIPESFASRRSMISSDAPGRSWMIKPPALTDGIVFVHQDSESDGGRNLLGCCKIVSQIFRDLTRDELCLSHIRLF